ncbi:hypothetical protein M2651_06685 [Clostridium sp. SYSU_GA19001]|uniref:DUF7922 domain-containing protein n=1 Tax=Clostridium caldaquaticum TaxID=2940653 RepID=UPI0020770E47|nr:hypothetical protein [Clostridium caldaquaticum]MCM8710713.1 hypothetical protein [Clostridium caldaquaticum]
MTQKKSYSRYFIILQEDEKGYALASDKLPSGYAKLEIKNDKCKISYYVQNLKKESAPYYMILICGKKDVNKLIKLNELNIDDHGRAEVCYEYPAENVANCGINIDKVIGAGIVKFMNSNLIPVMSGFTTTDIPEWKSFTVIEEEMKRNEDKEVKEVNKVKEAEVLEKVVENKNEQAEEIKAEPENIFDEYEQKIEELKNKDNNKEKPVQSEEENMKRDNINQEIKADEVEETDEYEETDEVEETNEFEDSRHKKKKSKKDSCEDKEKSKHEDKNYPKGRAGEFFMNLAAGFEELEGICTEIKRCRWFKVPVNRPEDMTNCREYNKYTVAYYPMMNYYPYINKFGHFVLGYKCDKDGKMKYLIYGIPGTKSRTDQPFGGKTGFVTWVPLREGEEDEDSFGYWLMFYDFRNSTIVIPVK